MKKQIFVTNFTIMLSLFTISCQDSEQKQIPPPTSKAVYVLNAIATSISVINLEEEKVYNDVATVGTWPNQLVYHKGKVYCVNSGSNNIMIFDADSWEAETPLNLSTGNNPMNMVFFNDDIVYVACSVSNKVLQVNMDSKTVIRRINAGLGATGIALANGKIYISNTAFDGNSSTYGQGTVTVLDGASGDSLNTINVSTNPQYIGLAPDGNVHTICTGNYADVSGKVSVIDPATDTVIKTFMTGGTPGSADFSHRENRGYLSVWGSGLLVYDILTGEILQGINDPFLGRGGSGVLVDPEDFIFVSVWEDDQVIKLDLEGNILSTYDVGDSPQALAIKIE